MFKLGPAELALIALIVLIIFGPKRLPELGKGIGQFIKNFSKSMKGEGDDKDPKNPPAST